MLMVAGGVRRFLRATPDGLEVPREFCENSCVEVLFLFCSRTDNNVVFQKGDVLTAEENCVGVL